MGPIRGFRIVNLRVRDKVACPDLTVDLADHPHVVLGLENGGGKSTLLAFLIHIFLPGAQQFLPRIAQRRQKKQGAEKRIEHYVPGGPPTHVVLDAELPPLTPGRPPRRVFIGACLNKPAGSAAHTPVEEFFWTLPATEQVPTLAELPLRAATGRLLDHREWRAYLDQERKSRPGRGVEIVDGPTNWNLHLREILKIDVEFVKTWLLAMNQDEGAADHVFTYASSRDFLNSLIKATAPPKLVDDLKATLVATGEDADRLALDRRRLALMSALAHQSAALRDHNEHLTDLDTARTDLIDHLQVAERDLTAAARDHDHTLATATGNHADAEATRNSALGDYADAHSRETAGRLQLAELRLSEAAEDLARSRADLTETEQLAESAKAAALLAEQETARYRIQEITALLAAKTRDAEPLRLMASSAVQVWNTRLDAEHRRLAAGQARAQDAEQAARESRKGAQEQRVEAAGDLARTSAAADAHQKALAGCEAALAEAVTAGHLAPGQAPADARAEAEALHDERCSERDETRARISRHGRDLDQLAARQAHLVRQAAQIRAEATARAAEAEHLQTATRTLTEHLRSSGLVDLDPITLDDHATTVAELLGAVAEQAKSRELDAAVRATEASRSAHAIEDTGLLPPRTDVAELCRQAAAAQLGARSGWSYLSTLPSDVAELAVSRHPALADGVVVNIPEDLDAVVELATRLQGGLHAPLAIAGPEALHADSDSAAHMTVVLPDEGHWSTDAARTQAARRHAEHTRHAQERTALGARHDQAQLLLSRLEEWTTTVGPGGLLAATQAADEAAEEAARAEDACAGIAESIAARTERRLADESRLEEQDRAVEKAASTVERLARLVEHDTRRTEAKDALSVAVRAHAEAQERTVAAEEAAAAAEEAEKAARTARDTAATAIAELRATRSTAAALRDETVCATDPVAPQDSALDLASAAEIATARHQLWSGAVSDPQLQADRKLQHDRLTKLLAGVDRFPGTVQAAARRLRSQDPTRSADDHRTDAEQAGEQRVRLSHAIGALETLNHQRKTEVEQVRNELRSLRRSPRLGAEHTASSLPEAEAVLRVLAGLREDALAARTRAETRLEAAAAALHQAQHRRDLVAQTATLVRAPLPLLAAAGKLTRAVDIEDRAFQTGDSRPAEPGPESLRCLLDLASAADPGDRSGALLRAAAADLEDLATDLRRRLNDREERANADLETLEAALRDADPDVVSGDRLVHLLRGMRRQTLLHGAALHHRDVTERLTLLQHTVGTFDARVEAAAHTAYAIVQKLLRGIRATVRDSLLPTTPAMGRWAGLPLLKLAGLDTLTVDQRRTAVHSLLQGWFTPDSGSTRPNFDADATLHALVEAVTPNFTAKVLIPSDPLDPEHKPVDRLAVETSGGEGVTFALILAALLAARRASAHGHRRTTLLLDNPFAKVTKPSFLRLARDVATALGVRFVPFTAIRDLGALTVFPALVQLRVSRRESANVVVPLDLDEQLLQPLLRDGTLFVSPTERDTAAQDTGHNPGPWPTMSAATVHTDLALFAEDDLA